jgi:hypothetical protein
VGIRESLNKAPTVAFGATVVLVVAAVSLVTIQARTQDGPRPASGNAFYSTDNGKTWFTDRADKPSPFDKDGKQAYRVFVWKCAHGKAFVSHLERISPTANKRLADLQQARRRAGSVSTTAPEPPPAAMAMIVSRDIEVKDPGADEAGGWVKASSPEGRQVTAPVCPDGGGKDVEPVVP